ncbi:MAG: translation elongation factor EF-1beta [Candidatus Methanomethylophilaceae archaeon]|jgi:elongation factor 1-beta
MTIAAAYELFPSDADADMDAISKAVSGVIPAGVKITETEIRPVAFGLKKVFVGFVIDDSDESVGTKLEEGLRSIPGVENIECVASTNL